MAIYSASNPDVKSTGRDLTLPDAQGYVETKKTKIGAASKIPVMRGVVERFPRSMYQIARVSHLGCIKYDAPEGDMDYLEVPEGVGTFTDAMGRHTLDEKLKGPINLEKGGKLPANGLAVLHAAQTAWNALARLERKLVEYELAGHHVSDLMDRVNGGELTVDQANDFLT